MHGKKGVSYLIRIMKFENQKVTFVYNPHSEPSSDISEKLVSNYSHTAGENRNFVVSSGIRTRIVYLDRRSPIELSSQRGLVASLIQFKYTKYFRDKSTFDLEEIPGDASSNLALETTNFHCILQCQNNL